MTVLNPWYILEVSPRSGAPFSVPTYAKWDFKHRFPKPVVLGWSTTTLLEEATSYNSKGGAERAIPDLPPHLTARAVPKILEGFQNDLVRVQLREAKRPTEIYWLQYSVTVYPEWALTMNIQEAFLFATSEVGKEAAAHFVAGPFRNSSWSATIVPYGHKDTQLFGPVPKLPANRWTLLLDEGFLA